MSRIKLLLDLIGDVRTVADDLQAIADAITSDRPEADAEPVREAAPEPAAKEPEEAIRLEDVRAVLAARSRDGYAAQVRELIARYGGSKLSDIDPARYGEMLKDAEVFADAT